MNLKNKKIRYLAGFKSASDLYRLVIPKDAMISQGYNADMSPQIRVHRDRFGNIMDVDHPEADIIVMARPLAKDTASIIKIITTKYNIPVIVDIDDDFETIPKGNKAAYLSIRNPTQPANVYWMDISLRYVAGITVTTRKLEERYFPVAPTYRVRNYILDSCLDTNITKNDERWGWTGNIDVHPRDVASLGNSVRKLTDDGFKFCHVGTGRRKLCKLLEMEQDEVLSLDKSLPFHTYLQYMGNMKVGVVPLEPLPFNDYKSNLKGLEFASMGTPVVASPADAYIEYAQSNGVLLARDANEWYDRVKRLLTDEVYYKEMQAMHREAASQWTINRNVQRWVDIITEVYNNWHS